MVTSASYFRDGLGLGPVEELAIGALPLLYGERTMGGYIHHHIGCRCRMHRKEIAFSPKSPRSLGALAAVFLSSSLLREGGRGE